jgi:hypothetical protein
MGDRRTAEIRMTEGSLYVYTHWHGSKMPEMARAAIRAAKPRWNDEAFAARIIVDVLTEPGRDKETGFGLMLSPGVEDEYADASPSITIDLVEQQLSVENRYGGRLVENRWQARSEVTIQSFAGIAK